MDLKVHKPMIEWELHNLKHLCIEEYEDAALILQEDQGMEMGMGMLNSLISLKINNCLKLEHLSSIIFKSLCSLECLEISCLPLFESIPDLSNSISLQLLNIFNLSLLEFISDVTTSPLLKD